MHLFSNFYLAMQQYLCCKLFHSWSPKWRPFRRKSAVYLVNYTIFADSSVCRTPLLASLTPKALFFTSFRTMYDSAATTSGIGRNLQKLRRPPWRRPPRRRPSREKRRSVNRDFFPALSNACVFHN